MQTRIVGHLGMEAESEARTLGDGHRVVAEGGNNLDTRADALDQRGADEDGAEGGHTEGGDGEVRLVRVHLAAVAVAADAEVEGTERQLVGPALEDLTAQEKHT